MHGWDAFKVARISSAGGPRTIYVKLVTVVHTCWGGGALPFPDMPNFQHVSCMRCMKCFFVYDDGLTGDLYKACEHVAIIGVKGCLTTGFATR